MEQIKNIEDFEGRVIDRVVELDMDSVFFIFKDDSFGIVRGCGWEEPYAEIDVEDYNLEPCEWNYRDLFQLGFVSEEQHNNLAEKYNILNEERRRKSELEKLEILKQKYPEQFK